jgi:hypothetical protein
VSPQSASNGPRRSWRSSGVVDRESRAPDASRVDSSRDRRERATLASLPPGLGPAQPAHPPTSHPDPQNIAPTPNSPLAGRRGGRAAGNVKGWRGAHGVGQSERAEWDRHGATMDPEARRPALHPSPPQISSAGYGQRAPVPQNHVPAREGCARGEEVGGWSSAPQRGSSAPPSPQLCVGNSTAMLRDPLMRRTEWRWGGSFWGRRPSDAATSRTAGLQRTSHSLPHHVAPNASATQGQPCELLRRAGVSALTATFTASLPDCPCVGKMAHTE